MGHFPWHILFVAGYILLIQCWTRHLHPWNLERCGGRRAQCHGMLPLEMLPVDIARISPRIWQHILYYVYIYTYIYIHTYIYIYIYIYKWRIQWDKPQRMSKLDILYISFRERLDMNLCLSYHELSRVITKVGLTGESGSFLSEWWRGIN